MKKRKLGKSGLETAPLAFGGNVFGWTADESMSFKLLDAFVDAGFNFIDTADVYSKWVPGNKGGESETIIGKWIKQSGKRDKVLIATKIGVELAPDKKGLSRNYILRGVEDSLRLLQTDNIDLYQSHRDDEHTPLEETLEAYQRLIHGGKVRAIGASNYRAERLRESLKVSAEHDYPRYETLQPEYNLCERVDFERDLEPLCLREGIGVISYYSLASGFLSGKYRSETDLSRSPRGTRVQKYLNDKGYQLLAALDEVASRHNSTPARVALAWLIARPSVTAPIASATNLDQLQDLFAATRLNLEADSIELLNQASAYDVEARQ
jgi:aryl-alcohol dehydrogenase-like predicted oxidoreductase